MTLDLNPQDFKSLLDKTTELVLDRFKDLDTRKAYHDYSQKEVESWFDEPLPLEGMDIDDLLAVVQQRVMEVATYNVGENMYSYVMSGGSQMGIVAEKLSATVNQNVAKWHLAPSMSEIEKRVIQWGKAMIDYPGEGGGVMVSGGSAANLAGLTVARNVFFERLNIRKKGLFGLKPFRVYASSEVHSCVDKSLDVLGIGTDNLVKIAINDDHTINLSDLEAKITADQAQGFAPFCVIGNAGTVNTGAIDDMTALAAIAKKYSLWFHIDGAYGGLAASLDHLKPQYKGMELADSVAIDFHKWLYQPFEAGCLLVKDWTALQKAYFTKAVYLDPALEQVDRFNFNEHYFQLSRNTKAFKIWLSIKAYGFDAIKAMIQKDIDLTDYLIEEVNAAADFTLTGKANLAIACFNYTAGLDKEVDIIALNQKMVPLIEQDGRVFITGTKLNGKFTLRACLINHRKKTSSIDYLLNVLREIGKTVLESEQG